MRGAESGSHLKDTKTQNSDLHRRRTQPTGDHVGFPFESVTQGSPLIPVVHEKHRKCMYQKVVFLDPTTKEKSIHRGRDFRFRAATRK